MQSAVADGSPQVITWKPNLLASASEYVEYTVLPLGSRSLQGLLYEHDSPSSTQQ